jgi:excisionase family DNA binding protein
MHDEYTRAAQPITLREYAELHGVSRHTARRWIEERGLPAERRGGGEARAATILVWTLDRPKRLAPGERKRAAVG